MNGFRFVSFRLISFRFVSFEAVGFGTASALARLYDALATHTKINNQYLVEKQSVVDFATSKATQGDDLVLLRPMSFSKVGKRSFICYLRFLWL